MANNTIFESDISYPIRYEYVGLPATGYELAKQQLLNLAQEIEDAKRPGYTQNSEDVLENFKKAAEMNGITPMQAWGTYFYKHVAAILSHAKDPNIPQAEKLDGRFADAINYLLLGYFMIQEENKSSINQQKLPF